MSEFCGCCGRPGKRTAGYDGLWCADCRKHLTPPRRLLLTGAETQHPWDRTYFAQHGVPCPFDVTRAPIAGGRTA